MPESIIETMNKIAEAKGENVAQLVADCINLGITIGESKKKQDAENTQS